MEYHYSVELQQTKFLPEDTVRCAEYPTEQFKSFKDCDIQHMREQLKGLGLEDYKPFWLVPDICQTSYVNFRLHNSLKYSSESSMSNSVFSIYSGVKSSSCPLPCTTTYVKTKSKHSKMTASWGINGGLHWVVLTLPNRLRVTETKYVPFSLGRLLSDLGGGLGLWMGLGVMQLFLACVKTSFDKL